ncbi:MAG: metalloregulator ArsR/SmtB family transcription factor [Candidatus Dormiibacterota bacterium]|jgi:ArsR family transcriptional regulator
MPNATAPTSTSDAPPRTKGCCQPVAGLLPEATAVALARVFTALDDPTRVQMVRILAEASEPVCVCDFTATFALAQPTISHHLARLREAGVVTSFRHGLWSFHQLNPEMPPAAAEAVALIRAAGRPGAG